MFFVRNFGVLIFVMIGISLLRTTGALRQTSGFLRLSQASYRNLQQKVMTKQLFLNGVRRLNMVSAEGVGKSVELKVTHAPEGLDTNLQATSDAHGNNKSDYSKKKLPSVMFVLGGPGAGKGTQSAKLAEKYGMLHLSAGDLLRAERDSGSANGKLINKILVEGGIVPVQITLDLLRAKILSTKCSRFLIDGFPRNYDNLNGWLESNMDAVCDVEGCIFFDCPESELEKRLLDRGKTSGRSDDNLESARKRFKTYRDSTMPIIEYYRDKDMLLEVGGDQSVEAVFRDLDVQMKPFIAEEITHLTQQQMVSLSTGNWDLYSSSCDPSMTSFESSASTSDTDLVSTERSTVRGVDAHKRYFDAFALQKSEIVDKPLVRLLGKVAVISYVRSMEEEGGREIRRYHETKIWSLVENEWKTVHLHLERSRSS